MFFECSNGNHANNYSQGMRKVAEYFGRITTYGTDIQYIIMKGTANIIMRPVRVKMGDNKVDRMLLGK